MDDDIKKQAKILTVDDEFALRQSLVAYLEDSDFYTCEGGDGQEGLEIFRKEKPDLVLTDIQMPKMNGLDFLQAIKKEAPDTPVIVISGAGGMNDVIHALQLGAWDYLTKPIADMGMLEHAINTCLERAQLVKDNKLYKETIEHNLFTLQEDQKAGRSVQIRLLPEKEKIVGEYLLSHTVNPSLYLSGDFVDYFTVNQTKTVVYLADISGHGSSSAFLTILLKNLVTKILTRYEFNSDSTILEPAKLMAEISNEIYDAKLGKYLTMIYAVIDSHTNEIEYGVGGHYPNPMMLNQNKNVTMLEGDGYPVGIIKDAKYKTRKLIFNKGCKLLIFSDGIIEVFLNDKSLAEQEAGLFELIKRTDGDITKILAELGIVEGDNKEKPDDVSILSIERR